MTGSGWICVRSISGVVGVFLAARPVLGFRTDSLGALRGLDRWKSRRSSGVLSRHFDFLNPKGWLWQGSATVGGAVKRRLETAVVFQWSVVSERQLGGWGFCRTAGRWNGVTELVLGGPGVSRGH
jgi:hypothetical protein